MDRKKSFLKSYEELIRWKNRSREEQLREESSAMTLPSDVRNSASSISTVTAGIVDCGRQICEESKDANYQFDFDDIYVDDRESTGPLASDVFGDISQSTPTTEFVQDLDFDRAYRELEETRKYVDRSREFREQLHFATQGIAALMTDSTVSPRRTVNSPERQTRDEEAGDRLPINRDTLQPEDVEAGARGEGCEPIMLCSEDLACGLAYQEYKLEAEITRRNQEFIKQMSVITEGLALLQKEPDVISVKPEVNSPDSPTDDESDYYQSMFEPSTSTHIDRDPGLQPLLGPEYRSMYEVGTSARLDSNSVRQPLSEPEGSSKFEASTSVHTDSHSLGLEYKGMYEASTSAHIDRGSVIQPLLASTSLQVDRDSAIKPLSVPEHKSMYEVSTSARIDSETQPLLRPERKRMSEASTSKRPDTESVMQLLLRPECRRMFEVTTSAQIHADPSIQPLLRPEYMCKTGTSARIDRSNSVMQSLLRPEYFEASTSAHVDLVGQPSLRTEYVCEASTSAHVDSAMQPSLRPVYVCEASTSDHVGPVKQPSQRPEYVCEASTSDHVGPVKQPSQRPEYVCEASTSDHVGPVKQPSQRPEYVCEPSTSKRVDSAMQPSLRTEYVCEASTSAHIDRKPSRQPLLLRPDFMDAQTLANIKLIDPFAAFSEEMACGLAAYRELEDMKMKRQSKECAAQMHLVAEGVAYLEKETSLISCALQDLDIGEDTDDNPIGSESSFNSSDLLMQSDPETIAEIVNETAPITVVETAAENVAETIATDILNEVQECVFAQTGPVFGPTAEEVEQMKSFEIKKSQFLKQLESAEEELEKLKRERESRKK